MEIWKPLKYGELDLTKRYEVSNTGKIRNIKTKKELKQLTHKSGYKILCISLGSREKKKVIKMHRAVAFMFVDGYKEGYEVNHKDFDRGNNNASNLEWITGIENIQYTARYSEKWIASVKVKVRCRQTGVIFDSVSEAAKWCGMKQSANISSNMKGILKHAGKHPITGEMLSWERV